MKKFFTLAAAAAVAMTPVVGVQAAPASEYQGHIECASFYTLLAAATEDDPAESDKFIGSAVAFVGKALALGTKTQDEIMADVESQMEADAAVATGDDAALNAFVEDRITRCS